MRKSVELCNFENLASFPLILVLYQNVATNLVNQGKMSINPNVTNATVVDPGQWCVRVCAHTLHSLIASSIFTALWCPIIPILNHPMMPYKALSSTMFLSVSWASFATGWPGQAGLLLPNGKFDVFGEEIDRFQEQFYRIVLGSYALFRNILHQEIGWFDVRNAGELSNCLIDDLGKDISNVSIFLLFARFLLYFQDKVKDGIKYVHIRWICTTPVWRIAKFSEKVPDFISLLARVLGAIIFALATGWQLTLVFLSVSPFIILIFNLTFRVRQTL